MALAWALALLLALVAADPATLTVATFGRVLDGSRHALVLFHAPWCTHCTEMMPAFEVLSRNMANEPSVVVARVDGSSDGGSPLRLRFGVTRYPTIKFFAQGSSEPEVSRSRASARAADESAPSRTTWGNATCGT